MSVKKTIARSFTVSTIEDGVSVQAQYAPNANPTSSQIHNVWQDGDLFMRTRETDSTTWSAWHRIVGENGGETDYSFAISQYRTTENAQTSPSDIGVNDWQDAPLAVTTAKPYLWSKVQQKSWNESTQQYVVDSTRYIRLTGEEGVVYDIQTPVDSIHIGENQTSATLSGTAKFFKKEGTKDKVQTVFYYGVYKRTGTTFAKVATGNANSYTFDALSVANTVNAVVIYLFAASYTGTAPESQTYLCKREMLVVDAGNSPYFADLDNEMDSVACTNAGKPSSEQTVETNVSLYRGSTKLGITIGVSDNTPSGSSYTSGTAKDGITVTWNNTTGNIKVKFSTTPTLAVTNVFCITLAATDNGATITRYLYFTVNGIRAALDGNPAALYRLIPIVNEIVKKKDGTYVPTGNTYITCDVTKNVGGTQSTPAASEYTLKYSLNGGAETTYTATSVKANQVTSNLVFILYVNSIVVDRETIGLVTDGDKGNTGDSAPVALANPDKITIPCGVTGYVSSSLTQGVTFSLKVGTNTATVTGVTAGTKPTGVTVTGQYNNAVTITITTTATASGLSAGVTFTVTGTYGGKTYSATITVALIGAIKGNQGDSITGPRGKTGRFYYYGGEFDSTNNTKTFIVNDAETPYFSHGVNAVTGLPNCHVYNPSENPSSALTMAQMWDNSSQSWNHAPWQTFTNDFQYLMTRAVFSDQAYLGSFVVNTDWLISQHGKVNHVASTAYTKFYPEFVNGGDLCENFDVNVNYILAGSAYFIGGKKYYIKVGGSSFSSGCQLNVRMYNGSSNVGNTLNLTASSPNGTITFEPTTSGTYYVRADCNAGGQTAKLTAYVECFVPNYAVDGRIGVSYQHDGVFGGVFKKSKTIITEENYNSFLDENYTDSTGIWIDILKAGSLIEFTNLSETKSVYMPSLGDSQKKNDYLRSLVGNTIIIYNKSNQSIEFTGRCYNESNLIPSTFITTVSQLITYLNEKISKHETVSPQLRPNYFIRFKCELTTNLNDTTGINEERIVWSYRIGKIIETL